MAEDQFLGEIRLMAFATPPAGWAPCNGQLLPINQNQALFSLLGTTYGGDGRTTFALPDLRGRVPMHSGDRHPTGETGGALQHTLNHAEMPLHTHRLVGSGGKESSNEPGSRVPGTSQDRAYSANPPAQALNPAAVKPTGGGQPHDNVQPTLVINFCIALNGIFPSRG